MTPKQARRAELDREFASSKTMTLAQYNVLLEDLEQQERKIAAAQALETKPAAAPAPAPAPEGMQKFVTYKSLVDALKGPLKTIGDNFKDTESILAALGQRMSAIETQTGKATDSEASIAALQQRVARLEAQIGALSMLLIGPSDARSKLAEIESLQARVQQLEQRPALQYRGVWSATSQYFEGEFCTHAGSLWAALQETASKPGTDNTWQLAAKRGADGKDAR